MDTSNTKSRSQQAKSPEQKKGPKPGDRGFPRKKDIYQLAPLLTQGQHLLVRQLLDRMPSKTNTLECWPSEETLAKVLNVCVRTIRNHVKKLQELGIIKVRRPTPKEKFLTNRYSFNFPWPVKLQEKLENQQSERPETSGGIHQGQNSTPREAESAGGQRQNSTSPEADSALNYIHNTLNNSYSFQEDCSLREIRSELRIGAGQISASGEQQSSRDNGSPQTGEGEDSTAVTADQEIEDTEPLLTDVLSYYKGRSDLDTPLSDDSLENDVEETAQNFLELHWDYKASPPRRAALRLPFDWGTNPALRASFRIAKHS